MLSFFRQVRGRRIAPPTRARALSLSLSSPFRCKGLCLSLSLSLPGGEPGVHPAPSPARERAPAFLGCLIFSPPKFSSEGLCCTGKGVSPPTRSVELSHDDHDKVRLIAHSCGQVLGDCYFWATTSNCRKLQTDHHESPPGYVPVLLCLSTCSLSFDRVKDKRVCSLSLSRSLSLLSSWPRTCHAYRIQPSLPSCKNPKTAKHLASSSTLPLSLSLFLSPGLWAEVSSSFRLRERARLPGPWGPPEISLSLSLSLSMLHHSARTCHLSGLLKT